MTVFIVKIAGVGATFPSAGKKRMGRRNRATIPHLGDDRRGRRERRLPATPKNEAPALLCRKFTRGPRHDAASPREGRAVGAQHKSPGLRGGPRRRRAGGDFYPLNHARVSISEVLFPGSRPRGLPAPPPGARRRRDGDDFHFQNQPQVYISEVLFPDSCSRGFPAPPPRRLRTAIVPGFYAPGRQNRRAARKPGDLALEYAAILRSGGAKTACRPRTGRPGPPADR